MASERLTQKKYWESRHKPQSGAAPDVPRPGLGSRIRSKYFPAIKRGYLKYLLYDVECRKCFPQGKLKILEVGSAPGQELITVHQKFGYIPYGVEYTKKGVEENQRLFSEHNLPQENVIHADFFDQEFQAEYRERFDLVMSHGFIEHFADIEGVVSRHASLLVPNGLLLITMPNFRWFNYLLALFFVKHTIKAHNLQVMKKKKFRACFDNDRFEILTCKYIGTLNFGFIYGLNKNRPKLMLMNLLMKLQRIIDVLLYSFFKRGFVESSLFSPKLMIICRKRQTPVDQSPEGE